MSRVVIQKAVTTEKSFKCQDIKVWSFLVAKDSNKSEIKNEIERLFGFKVASVNTTNLRPKLRQLKGSRVHTKRSSQKVARVSLKDKKAKIDLTKLKQ